MLLKKFESRSGLHKKLNLHLIRKKYEIYGYVSLDKLAEWNQLIPKKEDSGFTCKKEYQYINSLD